ncbi:mitochondrial import inner membrane translocase subunit Tim10 B [Tyto alba]|uniref:mitochondrial import inner membrane translocase subunit Tim10 B n=1 Tax=Tyto alba TaxID=56313 RepID=UPI001C6723E7|nr:mitochondrial import inner membrane translocase subunit Tim10 B [Tyto alba]
MEAGAEQQQQQLRSLRDFLLVYNRMTELCFRHCISNLNYRLLTGREETCLDGCAGKLLRSNHRLMSAYVALMPAIIQRRASHDEASTAPSPRDGPPEPPAPPAPTAPGPGGPTRGAVGT